MTLTTKTNGFVISDSPGGRRQAPGYQYYYLRFLSNGILTGNYGIDNVFLGGGLRPVP